MGEIIKSIENFQQISKNKTYFTQKKIVNEKLILSPSA